MCGHCSSITVCKVCGKNAEGFINRYSDIPIDFCKDCGAEYKTTVPDRQRIINDCVELIKDSQKFQTRLSRCDLLISHCQELLKYEKAGVSTTELPPSSLIKKYSSMRDQIIIAGVTEVAEKRRTQSERAKTVSTKLKYAKAALNEIKTFKSEIKDQVQFDKIEDSILDIVIALEAEVAKDPPNKKTPQKKIFALGDSQPNGYENICVYAQSMDKSIYDKIIIGNEQIPELPGGFKTLCIGLRAVIKSQKSKGVDYKQTLNQLYRTACIYDFYYGQPYIEEAGLPSWHLGNAINKKTFDSKRIPYNDIGYSKLSMLNGTDVKWILDQFGEPIKHSTAREYFSDLYKNAISKVVAKKKKKDEKYHKQIQGWLKG